MIEDVNLANKYDKTYFEGLKYLQPKDNFIGIDTIELSGFLQEKSIIKLGWDLECKFENKKLKYKYIKLPHNGIIRFIFNPFIIDYLDKSTGEIKQKTFHHAKIMFTVGGLLFGNNFFLGDHFLLNKCYKIIKNILDIDIGVFRIDRIDIAANFKFKTDYHPKAIAKNTSLPLYWKNKDCNHRDYKDSVYYSSSKELKKSQKNLIIYKKGENDKDHVRIEMRLLNLPVKINSTPFTKVFEGTLKINRTVSHFESYENSGWELYSSCIRYYVKVLGQMIRVSKYDKRSKSQIFQCRDQLHYQLFKLWEQTQRRLSMGSLSCVNV